MYISYVFEPFRKNINAKLINWHQNKQEAVIISEELKTYDISYVYSDYIIPIQFKRTSFNYIFGVEPNFEIICKKNPNAKKIYYATGAYYEHQNNIIINRTNDFNKRHNTAYPYVRLVPAHESCEVADYILQIGSTNTISTYPIHFQNKISLITPTSHSFKDININEKISSSSQSDYIWFGSYGNILKGLDLVLDYFMSRNELTLHVVGPLEKNFVKVYKNKLLKSSNINLYGFLDVDSPQFRKIVNKCSFNIYPSGSEGCPGSVINLQKLGVIPIVSKWAACDSIEMLGYKLEDIDSLNIEKAVIWSQNMRPQIFKELVLLNHEYCINTYNNESFKDSLNRNLSKLLV